MRPVLLLPACAFVAALVCGCQPPDTPFPAVDETKAAIALQNLHRLYSGGTNIDWVSKELADSKEPDGALVLNAYLLFLSMEDARRFRLMAIHRSIVKSIVRIEGPGGDIDFEVRPNYRYEHGVQIATPPLEDGRYVFHIAKTYIDQEDQLEIAVQTDRRDYDYAEVHSGPFYPQSAPRLLSVRCWPDYGGHGMSLYFSEWIDRASLEGAVTLHVGQSEWSLSASTDSQGNSFAFYLPSAIDTYAPFELELSEHIQGYDEGAFLDSDYSGEQGPGPLKITITLADYCEQETSWHPDAL